MRKTFMEVHGNVVNNCMIFRVIFSVWQFAFKKITQQFMQKSTQCFQGVAEQTEQ